MKVLAKSHQFLTFTTAPNLQAAVAYGLGKDDGYFEGMRQNFARSRDRFTAGLEPLGFDVIPSQGTYFLNIDIAPWARPTTSPSAAASSWSMASRRSRSRPSMRKAR